MASKAPHGLDIYEQLIDLIMTLTPLQAKNLYNELCPRYNKRMHTKKYNENGELDPENGKVRLTEYQYKAIRAQFGDTFMRRAFAEITRYIEFLEANQGTNSKYKAKLRDYNSKTHNAIIAHEDGWVYQKCKSFICTDRPKININPYLIEDFNTAKEYIRSLSPELRQSMDVQLLIQKFPELKDVD